MDLQLNNNQSPDVFWFCRHVLYLVFHEVEFAVVSDPAPAPVPTRPPRRPTAHSCGWHLPCPISRRRMRRTSKRCAEAHMPRTAVHSTCSTLTFAFPPLRLSPARPGAGPAGRRVRVEGRSLSRCAPCSLRTSPRRRTPSRAVQTPLTYGRLLVLVRWLSRRTCRGPTFSRAIGAFSRRRSLSAASLSIAI